uniref:NADH-ubiquinone oxidoreductase chain 3 n=1 Tax=Scolopendra dehaani TaxID=2609776 RepID=A0A343JML5_SCODE|nr:NAHD dehydrogenase subunit 3 [Scolopendra dehaani]
MIFLISLTTMITLSLMLISSLLSKKSMKDREKSSPFECGFDPFKTARLPFSLQFFMIAIIFLVFDVEITVLLPIPLLIMQTKNTLPFIMTMLFISFLLLGLYFEWLKGALDWSK